MDWLTPLICRTIGCTSIFAHWWEWPHRRICSPLADRAVRGIGFHDAYEHMSDDEFTAHVKSLHRR